MSILLFSFALEFCNNNSNSLIVFTIDSLSDNEVVKFINEDVIQASGKGLFEVKGEFKNDEINVESFVEYFKDLGFKVLLEYDPHTYKWSYKISWFKH